MLLSLNPPDLEAFKEQVRQKIDAEAEVFRARFITPGSGQALTYMEKEKQALGRQQNPNYSAPLVVAEAQARGITEQEAAQLFLDTAATWREMSAAIEGKRITHKVAVDNATTVAEVVAASNPDWESLVTA